MIRAMCAFMAIVSCRGALRSNTRRERVVAPSEVNFYEIQAEASFMSKGIGALVEKMQHLESDIQGANRTEVRVREADSERHRTKMEALRAKLASASRFGEAQREKAARLEDDLNHTDLLARGAEE